jgi:hypothetical protein
MLLLTLPTPQLSNRRQHLPGSPHWGPSWKRAVGTLRKATEGAIYHARPLSRFSADVVGTEIIDHIGELDSRALCVLYVMLGDLIRLSKKGDRQW